MAAFLALVALAVQPAGACTGDCSANGAVSIDELLIGVNISLGRAPLATCDRFDRDTSGTVTVDELVDAVGFALAGCAPTPTASPTPTATQGPNRPPQLPPPSVYPAYPGNPIRFAIAAIDPDGDAVRCTSQDLPAGAVLDEVSRVFTWTPGEDQLGPFYVPYACRDTADPPGSAAGQLVFQVTPLDACQIPACDPATGCESSAPPLTEPCCTGEPERVGLPAVGCPEGLRLSVGRNPLGFGRMQSCDLYKITNFAQSRAVARFNIETRCLNLNNRVTIHARMETKERPQVFNEEVRTFLTASPDGLTGVRAVAFEIGNRPYFDMQDAEANLVVSVTDQDDVTVTESLRLRLTFTEIPDLPDPTRTATPTATPTQPQ